jgi:hypothetical protein
MTYEQFHNALRILQSVDRYEIEAAGFPITDLDWARFRDMPLTGFILMADAGSRAVYQVIENRQPPHLKDPGQQIEIPDVIEAANKLVEGGNLDRMRTALQQIADGPPSEVRDEWGGLSEEAFYEAHYEWAQETACNAIKRGQR